MAAIPIAYMYAAMAAVTVASAVSAADTARRQDHAQQDAAKYNAEVSKQNAQTALQAAGANEEAQRRRSAQILGSQRAALAQSGADLNATGGDLYQQSAANAELDALNIRYGGEMQARGQTTQSTLDLMSADAAGQRARAATNQGYYGAASGALSSYGGYRQSQLSTKTPASTT